MGRSRFRFGESPFPHFLTCTVVGWLPVFTRPETVQILLDSWQFLQDQDRLTLLGYVVLENHIHFIASAEDLAKEVGDFKSYTARRIIDYLKRTPGPHPARRPGVPQGAAQRAIDRSSCGRREAIRRSSRPRRCCGRNWSTSTRTRSSEGYVSDPTHWRYSSARNYARIEALVSVSTDW